MFCLSFQNSQQGSTFVETGLDNFRVIRSSSIADPNKIQPGSDGMLPSNQLDIPSHSCVLAPPSSSVMPPPPSRNIPPPPQPHRSVPLPPTHMSLPPPLPKFSSSKMLSRKENMSLVSPGPTAPQRSLNARPVSPPKLHAQLPAKEPSDGKTNVRPVSDTLLKLMDYGDDDDDNIDATDNQSQNSGQ